MDARDRERSTGEQRAKRMERRPPQLEFREYRPGDEEALLATFNRTFAGIDPGFEPRSLEE